MQNLYFLDDLYKTEKSDRFLAILWHFLAVPQAGARGSSAGLPWPGRFLGGHQQSPACSPLAACTEIIWFGIFLLIVLFFEEMDRFLRYNVTLKKQNFESWLLEVNVSSCMLCAALQRCWSTLLSDSISFFGLNGGGGFFFFHFLLKQSWLIFVQWCELRKCSLSSHLPSWGFFLRVCIVILNGMQVF